MPTDCDPVPDLDERTARLGRQWFAEVRQQQRADEEAGAKRRRFETDADPAGDSGLWDWLAGDGGADGCDAGPGD